MYEGAVPRTSPAPNPIYNPVCEKAPHRRKAEDVPTEHLTVCYILCDEPDSRRHCVPDHPPTTAPLSPAVKRIRRCVLAGTDPLGKSCAKQGIVLNISVCRSAKFSNLADPPHSIMFSCAHIKSTIRIFLNSIMSILIEYARSALFNSVFRILKYPIPVELGEGLHQNRD
jgi:hypothetical protein